MPKRTDISKILIIGSGPIVIGQACEFDYSGAQACKALREEGYEVVLVNSNPATIMTDPEMADATYVEPITPKVVEEIIKKERPDAPAAHHGRPDGVEHGGGPRGERCTRRAGRGTHRRQATRHPLRGRSRPVQEGDARDWPRSAPERGRYHDGRGLGGGARHRLSDYPASRLYVGRLGRSRGVHRG